MPVFVPVRKRHPRLTTEKRAMPDEEQRHMPEKTHHDCRCSECNNISAMADRVDGWKTAESLLLKNNDGTPRVWGEGDDGYTIGPDNVLLLANWLLYGPDEDD